jgi:exosome complex RNA-binding protein Rrp4
MLSCKNVDKSNSIISNGDIWTDNKDQDDSKQFIENFYDITKKKKKSQFKKILTVRIINVD